MAADTWPEDIPIWVDDVQKWMTGLTRRTTCDDVIYALLYSREQLETDSPEHYAVFERWRAVERPLQGRTKIVKVWTAWGVEQPNVQLIVRRLDDYFMPPGVGSSRTRRRHRYSKAQRAKHLTNCRCSGRPQCVRCGKLRALEHLLKHMVRQERRLQDLQQRMQDTERLIAEHEARLHARRVLQDGRDYVQDSYLEHDSPDSSSSSSEDPLDSVLLSVGEDRLDEYIDQCNKLCDITQRLDHTHQVACNLAREIQTSSSDAGTSGHSVWPSSQRRPEIELEELHVQLTRAVAASVLQQQQELELARGLAFWESQLKDRTHKLTCLSRQMAAAEEAKNRQAAFLPETTLCSCTDQYNAPQSHTNGVVLTNGILNGVPTHTVGKCDSIECVTRYDKRPPNSSPVQPQTPQTSTTNILNPQNTALTSSETQRFHTTCPQPAKKPVSRHKPSPVLDRPVPGHNDYLWNWHDDSGLSQSASDSSTDSSMPGLDGDDNLQQTGHRFSGNKVTGKSLPQNNNHYSENSARQTIDLELHRHSQHLTVISFAQSCNAILEQCRQTTSKPECLDNDSTKTHGAINYHHISSPSTPFDNSNVLFVSKLPSVHTSAGHVPQSCSQRSAERLQVCARLDPSDLLPSNITPPRSKSVRFADELTSCRWREEGDSNSDDTGLSSMLSDDVTPLETLV